MWPFNRANKRRNIFRFWDGYQFRSVDPIEIVRLFAAHPKMDMQTHAKMAADGDIEAMGIALQATRDVFALKPFDGATELGLTDTEVMNLMADFGDFAADLKKNGNGRLTWPSAMEQVHSAVT